MMAVFRLQLLCWLSTSTQRTDRILFSCLVLSKQQCFSFGKTVLSGRYLSSVRKKGILDIVGATGNCLIYQGDLFVVVLFNKIFCVYKSLASFSSG